MIKTEEERLIFGLMISYIMTIGMAVYNQCFNTGRFDMMSY